MGDVSTRGSRPGVHFLEPLLGLQEVEHEVWGVAAFCTFLGMKLDCRASSLPCKLRAA